MVSKVPKVFQGTEVHQVPLALDPRGLQDRRVSRACQEDPDLQAHLVRRLFQFNYVVVQMRNQFSDLQGTQG